MTVKIVPVSIRINRFKMFPMGTVFKLNKCLGVVVEKTKTRCMAIDLLTSRVLVDNVACSRGHVYAPTLVRLLGNPSALEAVGFIEDVTEVLDRAASGSYEDFTKDFNIQLPKDEVKYPVKIHEGTTKTCDEQGKVCTISVLASGRVSQTFNFVTGETVANILRKSGFSPGPTMTVKIDGRSYEMESKLDSSCKMMIVSKSYKGNLN